MSQISFLRAELGYDMAVSRWEQGIASEAARAVINYGLASTAKGRCASTRSKMT